MDDADIDSRRGKSGQPRVAIDHAMFDKFYGLNSDHLRREADAVAVSSGKSVNPSVANAQAGLHRS